VQPGSQPCSHRAQHRDVGTIGRHTQRDIGSGRCGCVHRVPSVVGGGSHLKRPALSGGTHEGPRVAGPRSYGWSLPSRCYLETGEQEVLSCAHAFLVSQKISAISSILASSSSALAASISPLVPVAPASLVASLTRVWSCGYFSKCGGLK